MVHSQPSERWCCIQRENDVHETKAEDSTPFSKKKPDTYYLQVRVSFFLGERAFQVLKQRLSLFLTMLTKKLTIFLRATAHTSVSWPRGFVMRFHVYLTSIRQVYPSLCSVSKMLMFSPLVKTIIVF